MAAARPSVDEVFDEAIRRAPGSDRQEYLDQVCADDSDLRRRVERLLKSFAEAASFLEAPAAEPSPTLDQPLTESPGTQIGPYKLLQEIGEGGMGVVWMAEQHEPLRRRVALKLIKPGMDTRQVIGRFEAERQALAMMDHPNIAKVLDCGTTAAGHPYFVMELVKGIPITRYCDENHLTPRERLELFIPICQAIQHAHQKGIVHRDIKPSNVLVAEYDQKPVPKIIDFGVAKALNAQLTNKTMFTQLGQIVGTIEYMSPEQSRFNQLDVDTRSDIYSLGVLLYELLTGATPFDKTRMRAAAMDELMRIIRDEEPPRPSTRLSTIDSLPSIAANRKTEPKKLSLLLRGELDWIVMKAMEKDRARRYETAAGFAADVQRYLSDETVAACPPSASYRFHKFARRNKVALATGSLIAAALVVGIIGTGWQAIRATRAEIEAKTRLVAESKARQEADEARIGEQAQRVQTDQARLDADKARIEAEKESARANSVVAIINSFFASNDPSEPGFRGGDISLKQFVQDLSDRLPETITAEPKVEAEVRSIILRASGFASGGGFVEGFSQALQNLNRARELRAKAYPGDHPIQIESLIDVIDFHVFNGTNYDAYKDAAHDLLKRAQGLPNESNSKLRAYVKWLQLPSGEDQTVEAVCKEALVLAVRANDSHSACQIMQIMAETKLRQVLQSELDEPLLKTSLKEIETLIGQAIVEGEKLSHTPLEMAKLLNLLACVKRFQNEDDLGLNYAAHAKEIQVLFPSFTGNDLVARNLFFQAEGCLERSDAEGYRETIARLIELYDHDPSIQTRASGEYLFWASCLDQRAVDDWPGLTTRAQKWLDTRKRFDPVFALTEVGAIVYRAGDPATALSLLDQSEAIYEKYELDFPPLKSTYWRANRWYTWLFLSLTHHKIGNRAQAIDYYSRAARDTPRALLFAEVMGGLNSSVRHLQTEVETVLNLQPEDVVGESSDPMLFVARAVLLKNQGKLEESFAALGRAIELKPEMPKLWETRADWLVQAGRYTEAVGDYTKALELKGVSPDLRRKRGDCFTNLGQHALALDEYTAAIRTAQTLAQTSKFLQHRSRTHFELGHFADVLIDIERALNANPENVWAISQLGFDRAAQCPDANFRKSFLALASRAIAIAGVNQKIAYCHRGVLYRELGDIERAKADFLAAIELDPIFVDPYVHLAETNRRAGKYEQAIEFANKSIELSQTANSFHVRGDLYNNWGKYQQAIDDYSNAIALDSTNAFVWSWNNRGDCHKALRQFDQAIADYRAALERGFPDAPRIHRNLMDCYRETGQTDVALAELNRLIEQNPENTEHHQLRGDLLNQLARFPEAIDEYSRVIELNPNHADALHFRGHCFCHLGETEKALADYRRAEELEPKNTRLALARLGVLAASGQAEASQVEFDRLLSQSADPGRLLVDYGLELIRAGWLEQMESAVARAAEFGTSVESIMHYNLGCGYAVAGDKDRAFAALKRSIELGEGRATMVTRDLDLIGLRDDPRFAQLLAQLKWSEAFQSGRTKYEAGKFAEAIPDFTKATELNPKFGLLWHWRGSAYRANGQAAEADADFERYLTAFQQAVVDQPDNWIALNRRGEALSNVKHWNEALADFARAIDLAPDRPALHRNRATCFLEQQSWVKAADDLAHVIELGKADWQTHYHLALALLGAEDVVNYRATCQGMLAAFADNKDPLIANFVAWTCSLAPGALADYSGAIALARKSCEAQPESLQNKNTLGMLLVRAGQCDEAIRILLAVAEQIDQPDANPNTSPAYTWYALALACDAAGQVNAARGWYDKANAWTAKLLDDPASAGAAPVAWNRRLTLELIRKEAKSKFETDAKSQ